MPQGHVLQKVPLCLQGSCVNAYDKSGPCQIFLGNQHREALDRSSGANNSLSKRRMYAACLVGMGYLEALQNWTGHSGCP